MKTETFLKHLKADKYAYPDRLLKVVLEREVVKLERIRNQYLAEWRHDNDQLYMFISFSNFISNRPHAVHLHRQYELVDRIIGHTIELQKQNTQ